MMFSRHYPSYCKGLLLGGCSSEYPPISGRLFGGTLSLAFKLTPEDDLWKIIPESCPKISKERLSRAILRDGVDYTKWSTCASMLTESQEGTYVKCLALSKCRVLIFNGENDYRKAEDKFMEVLGDRGTLLVIKGADHYLFLDEVYINELSESIFAFVNQVVEEESQL